MTDAIKKLLLWVLGQVPLGAGFAAAWPQVKQHPVISILIVVTYQVMLFAVGFVKKVWGELEPEATKATATWAKTFILNRFSRFRRHYNKQMIYEHRTFNVKGLRTQGTYKLNLDTVFVDLRITPNTPQAVPRHIGAPLREGTTTSIWELLRRCQKQQTALAILGAPGSGKTTLLQHIALTLASNRQRKYRIKALLPVLLFLRDHRTVLTGESPPSLGSLLHTYFSTRQEFPTPPPHWFDRQLKAGRCLVLLDGLDEVADQHERQRISGWVDQQIRGYPKTQVIVTSRPTGYHSAPLMEAMVTEVQPFNQEQVKHFIQKWYLENEIDSRRGERDTGVDQDARRGARELLERLQRTPALNDLTRNPLLLTMVAMVHRYRGALPGKRVELYAEICDVLLEHRATAKGLADSLNASQKRTALQPLAAAMMTGGVRTIETGAALSILNAPLSHVGVSDTAQAAFLESIRDGSGLIQEIETGVWGFAHLTFQEYLTAAHWADTGAPTHWNTYLDNSWWDETLLLYAAQKDATELITAYINHPDLTLKMARQLGNCLHEARAIMPKVRSQADNILRNAAQAPRLKLFSAGAEYLLNQRLWRLEEASATTVIDTQTITWAEYQLFANETKRYPEHWVDIYHFPETMAEAPACGISSFNAQLFCEWLTKRVGGTVQFRIPTLLEVKEVLTAPNLLRTFWTMKDSMYHIHGMTSHQHQEYLDLIQPHYSFINNLCNFSFNNKHNKSIKSITNLAYNHFFASDILTHDDIIMAITAAFHRHLPQKHRLREISYKISLYLDNYIKSHHKYHQSFSSLTMNKDWTTILQILDEVKQPTSIPFQWSIILLRDIINILSSGSKPYHLRIYIIHLCTILLEGLGFLINTHTPFYWRWKSRKQVQAYRAIKDELLGSLTWHIMILMRMEKKLPEWEGILIVRTIEQE